MVATKSHLVGQRLQVAWCDHSTFHGSAIMNLHDFLEGTFIFIVHPQNMYYIDDTPMLDK